MRVHLDPALGAKNLASLNPLQIQHLYRKKLQAGLAPGSVRRIHITLHKALQDAVRWYMLPRNVASAVTPPKGAAREIKLDYRRGQAAAFRGFWGASGGLVRAGGDYGDATGRATGA